MEYPDRFLGNRKMLKFLDFSNDDIQENFDLLKKYENYKGDIRTVNWLIPNFKHALYGGIYTILRFANYFQINKNIQNRIIIYDFKKVNIQEKKKNIIDNFPGLSNAEFIFYNAYRRNVDDLPECDAIISTLWNSCYISLKFKKTKKKFYFIQDYETMFSAAGTIDSIYADLTHNFGFEGIVNSQGLAEFLKENYGIKCVSFNPAVSKESYYINSDDLKDKLKKKDPLNLIFYGRPGNDRNGFELGVTALLKIKEKYGDRVNINSVGDDWKEEDYGVAGKIRNLGRLSSFKDIADLYRKSDIGLSFMFTKHPSYQPYEYMATGCAVVANFNKANEWFLKNWNNCLLSYPTPSGIAEKISELIENNSLRANIVLSGLATIDKYNWDDECEKIFKYINPGVGKSAKKIAIYTAIFGDKDDIKEPAHKIEQADLFCFTDNPRLKSEAFDIKVVEPTFNDPTRNARMYKILAHKFLPDYEYSIWMDGNVKIKTNEIKNLIDECLSKHDLAMHIHPERDCIYKEAEECIRIKKENPEILREQAEIYRKEGYPENNGLVVTSVILRRNSSEVKKINELWWEELNKYSKRDQMSFNYAAWKNNFKFYVIKKDIFSNDNFETVPHKIKSSVSSLAEVLEMKNAEISKLAEIISKQENEIISLKSHAFLGRQVWMTKKKTKRIFENMINDDNEIFELFRKAYFLLKKEGALQIFKYFLKYLNYGREYFDSKEYRENKK